MISEECNDWAGVYKVQTFGTTQTANKFSRSSKASNDVMDGLDLAISAEKFDANPVHANAFLMILLWTFAKAL